MDIVLDTCLITDAKVAEDWKRLYFENKQLTYFSSYEFNLTFIKYFNKNRHRRGMKITIVRVKDKYGKTYMFLPLCQRHEAYYMIWDHSSVPFCDAIYSPDVDFEFFESVMRSLPDIISNTTVFFSKMNPESKFTDFLSSTYTAYKNTKYEKLQLLRPYKVTYAMMTNDYKREAESVREALRAEKIRFSTEFYLNSKLPKHIFDIVFNLYYNNPSYTARLKNKIYDKNSPISISLINGKNNFTAVSYMNGVPCAFISGFIKDDKLTVVRRSFDTQNRGYPIGDLAWCDVIKYSIEKLGLKTLDFGRLSKRPKAKMGAIAYKCPNFEVSL